MWFRARNIRIISLLMVFGLMIGLAGCSTFYSGFTDPDVRLIKVDVVRAKLLEQRFVLRFRIDNPNPFALSVRGLKYAVSLNEMKLTEGESNVSFSVPAYGHHQFDVPVRTNLWRHVKPIVKLLESPEQPIRYRLAGEVKTGFLFGPSVHLSRNGEIIPGDFIPE
ncbi:LEA type 2 family protein [Pseudomonas sp. UL073]|uniref:LEA type 2 family protein n=1 Tax=Zestomonas insulae TaxID=2809017 RepID=A0ABS2ICP7_9GAMM|nr:LEA type 2 family protein [Pseudomonas insulae]MBM7060495.1 LEA type 2 family protein [Pseudomonas insulae]